SPRMGGLLFVSLLLTACSAHSNGAVAGLAEGPSCTEDAAAPPRTMVTVHLVDASGRAPASAEVRAEPCCTTERTACPSSPIDADGRVVLEACPDDRTRDVIVSVETNPRWYIYTPPRAVRVCSASTEVTIRISRHPKPPT